MITLTKNMQTVNHSKIALALVFTLSSIYLFLSISKLESGNIIGKIITEKPTVQAWQKLNNSSDLLLTFIHIPKTSGSSFFNTVREAAVTADIKIFPNHQNSFNSPGCRKNREFGGTHCSFSELNDCFVTKRAQIGYENLQNPTNKYFSIIRNPIDRVISEYFWWHE